MRANCKQGHPLDELNTYISPKSQKRSCRICASNRVRRIYTANLLANRETNKVHMQTWRAANRERDRSNWTSLRKRKKDWLDTQKTACSCGEARIACLDFHHRDASKKDANLSVAVAHWSIARLQREMEKCEIICSNCHRCLHAAERAAEKVS